MTIIQGSLLSERAKSSEGTMRETGRFGCRERGATRAPRTKGESMTCAQREHLQKFFEEDPAIRTAYEFKEELCSLLNIKGQTKEECRTPILQLKEKVWQLLHEAPEIFKKPGRTIRQWFEPIIRMWHLSKNNCITEGFHRKVKLIRRRAYGYRNFENYRLGGLIEYGHIVV